MEEPKPVVQHAESAVGFEVVDQSFLEPCDGDGSIADSSKVQAGVLNVEILVEADFPTSGRLDCNFGEVWVAEEGGEFANGSWH